MTSISGALSRRPVLSYFILVFALSWGAILLAVGFKGLPVSEDQLPVLIVAMLLGPSVAAILMASITGGRQGVRDLFSRLLRWRVDARWYVVALSIAPISTAVILLVFSLFSSGYHTALSTTQDRVSLVIMWSAAALMVGFFEELGWTGFVLPRMRKSYGLFTTGLLVGVVWGAWHFLVNWESDSFLAAIPFVLLISRLFTWLPAFRILMVWVYDRTESQLVVTLMHCSLVFTTGVFDPVLEGENLILFLLAKAALFWLIVVAIMLFKQRQAQEHSL